MEVARRARDFGEEAEIAATSPQKRVERRLRPSKMMPIETRAVARRVQDAPSRPGDKIRA